MNKNTNSKAIKCLDRHSCELFANGQCAGNSTSCPLSKSNR